MKDEPIQGYPLLTHELINRTLDEVLSNGSMFKVYCNKKFYEEVREALEDEGLPFNESMLGLSVIEEQSKQSE